MRRFQRRSQFTDDGAGDEPNLRTAETHLSAAPPCAPAAVVPRAGIGRGRPLGTQQVLKPTDQNQDSVTYAPPSCGAVEIPVRPADFLSLSTESEQLRESGRFARVRDDISTTGQCPSESPAGPAQRKQFADVLVHPPVTEKTKTEREVNRESGRIFEEMFRRQPDSVLALDGMLVTVSGYLDNLKDTTTVRALFDLMSSRPADINGKVVMVLNCGIGILPLQCAKIGATFVIAIDSTPYAAVAVHLAKDNELEDRPNRLLCARKQIQRITGLKPRIPVKCGLFLPEWMMAPTFSSVGCSYRWDEKKHFVPENFATGISVTIVSKLEDIQKLPRDLPTVDTLICDWMGVGFFRGNLLRQVIIARDKWMSAPVVIPRYARLFITAISDDIIHKDRKRKEPSLGPSSCNQQYYNQDGETSPTWISECYGMLTWLPQCTVTASTLARFVRLRVFYVKFVRSTGYFDIMQPKRFLEKVTSLAASQDPHGDFHSPPKWYAFTRVYDAELVKEDGIRFTETFSVKALNVPSGCRVPLTGFVVHFDCPTGKGEEVFLSTAPSSTRTRYEQTIFGIPLPAPIISSKSKVNGRFTYIPCKEEDPMFILEYSVDSADCANLFYGTLEKPDL